MSGYTGDEILSFGLGSKIPPSRNKIPKNIMQRNKASCESESIFKIQNLEAKNARLRELLKECREYLNPNFQKKYYELRDKIKKELGGK